MINHPASAEKNNVRDRERAPLSVGLGILTGQTRPGSGISVSDEYRATVSIARKAEALGFDSVWLSEHHAADDGYLPSLLPMLGAIAAATDTLRLGTSVLLPVLQHPLRLAEDVAVVDQLSRGRVLLGIGFGWRSLEFETYGVPRSERAGRTAEIMKILRQLWSGEPAPFDGTYYRLPHMRVRPLPFTAGGPPIYLYGADEEPIRLAGALADGLIYSRAGPTAAARPATPKDINGVLKWADDARAGAKAIPLVLLLNAFVSSHDPWTVIADGVDHQFTAYARWRKDEEGAPLRAEEAQAAVEAGRRLVVAGDPAAVTAELRGWVDALTASRPLHLVVKLHYPGMPERRTVAALELFAGEVMPALRQSVSEKTARATGHLH